MSNKISASRDYQVLNFRLSKLMKSKGLTIATLSKKTGISVGAIQNIIKSPECNPTLEKIEAIANELGVSIGYLLGEIDQNNSSTVSAKIPLISWDMISDLATGKITISDIKTDEYHEIPDGLSKNSFALRVQDKVMRPLFNENTLLIFDPEKKIYDGCYALIYVQSTNSYIFREVIFDGATMYYKASNPEFGEQLNPLVQRDRIFAVLAKSQSQQFY